MASHGVDRDDKGEGLKRWMGEYVFYEAGKGEADIGGEEKENEIIPNAMKNNVDVLYISLPVCEVHLDTFSNPSIFRSSVLRVCGLRMGCGCFCKHIR